MRICAFEDGWIGGRAWPEQEETERMKTGRQAGRQASKHKRSKMKYYSKTWNALYGRKSPYAARHRQTSALTWNAALKIESYFLYIKNGVEKRDATEISCRDFLRLLSKAKYLIERHFFLDLATSGNTIHGLISGFAIKRRVQWWKSIPRWKYTKHIFLYTI